jgi:hypothetical protein
MTLPAFLFLVFCSALLHVFVAADPSFSWSPLQTLAETVEYVPHLQHPPISALEILQRVSPVIQKVHADSFVDDEDAKLSFGRLRRCV